MEWRLICDDAVSASFGLAADDFMARQVGTRASVPTLRLYTYRSHCALVGRHQNVEAEVNRAFCDTHGIAINRRPTGGGAIIMGAEQLGIALTLPVDAHAQNAGQASDAVQHRARELFANFSQGIIRGLEWLGVRAVFGGKNDIEVGRKKIAGLGIYHDKSGGLLFHASILVDLEIALMLRVLKTPFEKISDKAITTVAQRVTTVRRETRDDVTMGRVRSAIADGYVRRFNAKMMPCEFTSGELDGIARLEREKYLTRQWIEQRTWTGDCAGIARAKTPGGLVNVQLTLAGDVIKAIYITGDFFAEDDNVSALEGMLRWRSAEARAIDTAVNEFLGHAPNTFENITPNDLTRVVTRAVEDARRKAAAAEPYGCFINP